MAQKIEKEEMYINEKGNIKVSSFPFTVTRIKDGIETTDTLDLVEISKTSKKWSDKINAFYEKRSFVTIGRDDFDLMINSLS